MIKYTKFSKIQKYETTDNEDIKKMKADTFLNYIKFDLITKAYPVPKDILY